MADVPGVCGLFVHPLKACGAVALRRMELDAHGPVPDRRFMLVDAAGRFATQRDLPALATVRCSLGVGAADRAEPTSSAAAAERVGATAVCVHLEAPDLPARELPLGGLAGPRREVVCWGDRCQAIDQGDAWADWFSRVAGCPLRLVRLADDWRRPVDPRYAPQAATTSFTDGFPLLVLSQASLSDLNRRIGDGQPPLPMNRFRPNLVVDGCEAYAEDTWRRLRIVAPDGALRIELEIVKPCSRCVVTTTDQQTLERGPEPLRTLARYRRARLAGAPPAVYFGQNALHLGPGSIEIGDRVEVVERGPSPFAGSQPSR